MRGIVLDVGCRQKTQRNRNLLSSLPLEPSQLPKCTSQIHDKTFTRLEARRGRAVGHEYGLDDTEMKISTQTHAATLFNQAVDHAIQGLGV
jgi:hypothetical protein